MKLRRCPNCKKYFHVDKPSSKQICCCRKCSLEYKKKEKERDEYVSKSVDRINTSIQPIKRSSVLIKFKSTTKITKKILDKFIKNARYLRNYKCNCQCHRCNILNWNKHNAITVISEIQCLECPCPPIRFNAHELDILNSHIRIAYDKLYGHPYPKWLINDKMFLDLVIKLTISDGKNV